jgi:hypothetical protein
MYGYEVSSVFQLSAHKAERLRRMLVVSENYQNCKNGSVRNQLADAEREGPGANSLTEALRIHITWMRIRILLITFMRIQILLVTLIQIRILPFTLKRIWIQILAS